MNEVVAARRSVREFDSSREINDSTLGQLLWMSVGVNRPAATPSASGAASGRSNPTARNWQEIRAFVFGKNGVWEYRPVSHTLVLVKEGDHRSLVAGTKSFSQDFVMDAPCSIVFVADMTRLPEGGHVRSMALVDAGPHAKASYLTRINPPHLKIQTFPLHKYDTLKYLYNAHRLHLKYRFYTG